MQQPQIQAMFQEENVCDEISVIFSDIVGFVCFVCFQQNWSTASVVQMKYQPEPINKKKIMALLYYKREVYCERTE